MKNLKNFFTFTRKPHLREAIKFPNQLGNAYMRDKKVLLTNAGFVTILLFSLISIFSLSSSVQKDAHQKIEASRTERFNVITQCPESSQNLTRDINIMSRICGTDSVAKQIFLGWPEYFVGFKAKKESLDLDTFRSNVSLYKLTVKMPNNVWQKVKNMSTSDCSGKKQIHYGYTETIIGPAFYPFEEDALQYIGNPQNKNLKDLGIRTGEECLNYYITQYWAHIKELRKNS